MNQIIYGNLFSILPRIPDNLLILDPREDSQNKLLNKATIVVIVLKLLRLQLNILVIVTQHNRVILRKRRKYSISNLYHCDF